MKSLEQLHDEAMTLADQGDAERRRQGHSQARAFFAQALELERQALALAAPESQPTYAVLLRSAASLAIDAEQADEALRLIERGLASPLTPGLLREEFEELFDSLLGEAPPVAPAWKPFESPVDQVVERGDHLPPRLPVREVA